MTLPITQTVNNWKKICLIIKPETNDDNNNNTIN